MQQQLEASQTARDVEVLLIEAGFIQAANKRTGEPAPFLQGSPKLFVINAIHGDVEHAIGGGESEAHRTPMDAARYLIGMIQPKAAEPAEAVVPVTYTPAAEPAPAEPDPRDAELAALRARAEAAEQRIAELESSNHIDLSERPVEEVVGPLEALKAKIDAVRVQVPPDLEDAIAGEDVSSPAAIQKLTERLNIEKAELRRERLGGDNPTERETQVDRLLNWLAQFGEA